MVRYGRRKIGRSFIHMRYFVLESRLLAYYKKKPQDNVMVYVLSVYNKKEKYHRITMAAFNIQEALIWKEKIESVIDQPILIDVVGMQHQESQATNGNKYHSFEYKSGMDNGRNASSSDHESQFSAAEDEEDSHPNLSRRTTIGNGPPESVFDWTKELDSDLANQNSNNQAFSRKYWRLLQCQNGAMLSYFLSNFGLRIFEELLEVDFLPKSCSRAMKAVGVVEATCEEIFELVMSMDATRCEWDCSFQYGSLVEEVDGHTAILYHRLQLDWFPIIPSFELQSLLDQGLYGLVTSAMYATGVEMMMGVMVNVRVVLFRSREHENCGPQPGFVRAHIESGGFNISPMKPRNGRPRTQVQHLMQIDLKGWGVGYVSSFQQHCLLQMLNSVAGEILCASKQLGDVKLFLVNEDQFLYWNNILHTNIKIKSNLNLNQLPLESQKQHTLNSCSSLFLIPSFCSTVSHLLHFSTLFHGSTSTVFFMEVEPLQGSLQFSTVTGLREYFSQTDERSAAPRIPVMVNMTSVSTSSKRNQKLQSSSVHHRSASLDQIHAANRNAVLMDEYSDEDEDLQYTDQEALPSAIEVEDKRTAFEEEVIDQIDLSIFSGNLRHDDHDKARNCWALSDGSNFRVRSKRFCYDKSKIPAGKHLMDLVAVDWFKDTKRMDHVARRSGCAAQVASDKGLFSIVFNLQVPGSTHYSMVFYFVAKELVPGSLLQRFVDGDDEFRNSRLKLIPSVPKIDVDIGSSTVANGVLGLVIGVIMSLVVDMAFLVQANTTEELPERLIGAVRVSHIELSSAIVPRLESDP
ncbi:hypothetical protein DH2020_005818 [Rehmannia glutinosa]|uniref:START domain-containing protein n=1 Tax=Rehmannia glutinosa TaxID=99300 RepID=A0ABR0XH41_REHGL